ncbi:MAG: RNase adapter RapZ [Clostridiales bacterium]|nr:RNase adapter RapZ [Clostridiales bacterium]
MQIVIISGLSGAGKSLAVDAFEDMGYYCIDNLPPPLIKDFITLIKGDKNKLDKVAFVIDIRGGDFLDDFVLYEKALGDRNIDHKLIFLEASKIALLKRYAETRRQHPLAAGRTNAEAIDDEIERLAPIKEMSDIVIDTSDLKNTELAHVLRDFIQDSGQAKPFRFIVQSFGHKYGMPAEADFVFDVRFIPNPFYVEGMRELNGKDEAVREFVFGDEGSEARFFADEVLMMLGRLKPSFEREGKPSVNVAFGCTGGQHRSVAMAVYVADRLREAGENVVLRHREV